MNYIKDRETTIDYTYLGDLVSNSIFSEKINLLIFKQKNKESINNLDIICPLFNNFSKKKKTLILYLNNGIYEPIYLFKKLTNFKDNHNTRRITLLSYKELELIPNLKFIIDNIEKCGAKNKLFNTNYTNKELISKSKIILKIIE